MELYDFISITSNADLSKKGWGGGQGGGGGSRGSLLYYLAEINLRQCGTGKNETKGNVVESSQSFTLIFFFFLQKICQKEQKKYGQPFRKCEIQ